MTQVQAAAASPVGRAVQTGAGTILYPEEIRENGVVVEVFSAGRQFERVLDEAILKRLDWGKLGTCEGGSFWLPFDTGWVPLTNARIIVVRLLLVPGSPAALRYGEDVAIWTGRYVNHKADGNGGFSYDLGSLTEIMLEAPRRRYGDEAKWFGAAGERFFGTFTPPADLAEGDTYDETIGAYLTRLYANYPEAAWGHGPDLYYIEATSPADASEVSLDLDALGIAPVFQGVEIENTATEWGFQQSAQWRVLERRRSTAEMSLLTPRRFVVSKPDPATQEVSLNIVPAGGHQVQAVDGSLKPLKTFHSWIGSPAGGSHGVGKVVSPQVQSGSKIIAQRACYRLSDWVRLGAGVIGGPNEERGDATYRPISATLRWELNITQLTHTDAILFSTAIWISSTPNSSLEWYSYENESGAFIGYAVDTGIPYTFKLAQSAAVATARNDILVVAYELSDELVKEYKKASWGAEYFLHIAVQVFIREARASSNHATLTFLQEDFLEEQQLTNFPKPPEASAPFTRPPTYSVDGFPGIPIGPLRVSFTDPDRGAMSQFVAATSVQFGDGTLEASFETVAPRR